MLVVYKSYSTPKWHSKNNGGVRGCKGAKPNVELRELWVSSR